MKRIFSMSGIYVNGAPFRRLAGAAAVGIVVFAICACDEMAQQPSVGANLRTRFGSPQEFVQNPSIRQGLDTAGAQVNLGSNPPPLAGRYRADAEITSITLDRLRTQFEGQPIRSEICLFNQITAGRISLSERLAGIEAFGDGGYVTGDDARFTVWGESVQDFGTQAAQLGFHQLGFEEGTCMGRVAFILSGRKSSSGDLEDIFGTTVIVAFQCPGMYELGAPRENVHQVIREINGLSWSWAGTLELEGSCSG